MSFNAGMARPLTIEELTRIVVDARRARLKEWIDKHFNGQQAAFCYKHEINQGELSGLLKEKSFGEKRARSMELKAGMPYLYLDQVLPGNVTPIGLRERDIADKVAEIVRAMSAPGQFIALGRVQEIAIQYPAQESSVN